MEPGAGTAVISGMEAGCSDLPGVGDGTNAITGCSEALGNGGSGDSLKGASEQAANNKLKNNNEANFGSLTFTDRAPQIS
ncbi:hypothetical protein P40081_29610 [Paenibacillus sp. FSL P4-0081]|nr:hypothetical protein P40081_29610 [Paenibacillus sp. FSL P4-0081]